MGDERTGGRIPEPIGGDWTKWRRAGTPRSDSSHTSCLRRHLSRPRPSHSTPHPTVSYLQFDMRGGNGHRPIIPSRFSHPTMNHLHEKEV